MCGIAGILNFNREPVQEARIKKMASCMAHRGPDADEFYIGKEIALAHRRLSIIDLSEVANQPMWDQSGRYVIIFNGEMYNFRSVKEKLKHYPFKTQGDSEVILAAYAEWGPSCLNYFAGMFAFAIWDSAENRLFLARDRMGVKPLYYFSNSEHFAFASEVRSLLNSGFVQSRINPAGLYEFLHYQSVSFPHAIVRDIQQLQAGHYMLVENGKCHIEEYWSLTDTIADFDFNDEPAVKNRVRQLLQQSVERRLISDVPLGAFLSGGIDSSAIVGLMAETSDSVNTFTVGFSEKQFDESGYAGIIAKKFNTRHTLVQMEPGVFLDELPNALNSMDSPSGDGINTYVVSKAIRKSGLGVALSGLGGDELFAGYPLFRQFMQLQKRSFAWNLSSPLRKAAASFIPSAVGVRSDRIRQMLETDGCSVVEFYPISRQILSPGQIKKLIKYDLPAHTAVEQQLLHKKESIERFPLLSQITIAELMGYTQHTLLKDTDQMSMAVSLEVREPFFDHQLVEFVLNVPDNLKYPSSPKRLLIESLGNLLPSEIVHRPKQGFVFPWPLWMKNELNGFCEEHLIAFCQRDFVRPDIIRRQWNNFLQGDRSVRWMELWLFVILEYWLRKNSVE